jgi:cytochrome c peroxidase
MRTGSKTVRLVVAATAMYVGAFAIVALGAQTDKRPHLPAVSLNQLVVPVPPNIGDFIKDSDAAIRLGKALFWEVQASSDNWVACASCHFHAGADDRVKNQINPNLTNQDGTISKTFNQMASGNHGGPNYTLRAGDFPFHQLTNPDDRESAIAYDSNDVVGSAGIYASDFGSVLGVGSAAIYASDFGSLLGAIEKNTLAPDGVFQVGTPPIETRRTTGRNAPSVINAALNYRNFWDGRANSVFNGVTPFGPHDADARVWMDEWYLDDNDGVTKERAVPAVVRISYSSAASQSVGPALSDFEMSGAKRSFADLGQKLMWGWPLSQQQVSATDSVLGPYVDLAYPDDESGYGLTLGYEALIKQAFYPEFYSVPDAIYQASSGDTKHRQIEANFSLFWGLAIQAYESTLISNDTPYDRFVAGDRSALTLQEQRGLGIFSSDRGKCVNCHKGAEFTSASSRMILGSLTNDGISGEGPIENMLLGDNRTGIYDVGFYNIGVAPTGNDLGAGGTDPWGAPLSFSRQSKNQLSGGLAPDALTHSLNPCDFQVVDGCTVIFDPNIRDAVDGTFKMPSLRNVELTGPYFHTGGYATLEQVIDFYDRGGNARGVGTSTDTTGFGPNRSNFGIDVVPMGLTDVEKAALIAFLKSLTDDRVRYEKAPFDHPELLITNGAMGNNDVVQSSTNGNRADDLIRAVAVVGKNGHTWPIRPFTPKP